LHSGFRSRIAWNLDLKTTRLKLRAPLSNKIKLEFPARPMLGCVDVATPGDFSPTSGPSGSYGENLDYNEIEESAAVILPVYHNGALLFIGHALLPLEIPVCWQTANPQGGNGSASRSRRSTRTSGSAQTHPGDGRRDSRLGRGGITNRRRYRD
jgi:hypothetical protein